MSSKAKKKDWLDRSIGIVFILLVLLSIVIPVYVIMSWQKSGEIGDTFGGLANPLLSFLAAFLIYASLVKQKQVNVKQNERLEKLDEKELKKNAFDLLLRDASEIESLFSMISNSFYDKSKSTMVKATGLYAIVSTAKGYEAQQFINSLDVLVEDFNNYIFDRSTFIELNWTLSRVILLDELIQRSELFDADESYIKLRMSSLVENLLSSSVRLILNAVADHNENLVVNNKNGPRATNSMILDSIRKLQDESRLKYLCLSVEKLQLKYTPKRIKSGG